MSKRQKLIPVGISNRHFHISQKDLEVLFGAGYQLHTFRDISQKGQFAAEETIDVEGPKGKISGIRIVGPTRGQTQLEISRSDAYKLGIDPPVRYSGDLAGSPGAKLIGPKGEITLKEGIIVPQRHIHLSPRDAQRFGVRDRQRVFVAPVSKEALDPGCEPRTIIFANVLIRVDETFVLDFHLDTDEANASGLKNGDQVYIVRKDSKAQPVRNRKLITEHDVRQAIRQRRKISVPEGAIVTPAAVELAKAHNVFEK
ncbi:phosphate propanoyltransferase [candidate division KSB1 bacterium]|nr:phosphate propanoyltransferase [candidate division KSB1 bacterium]